MEMLLEDKMLAVRTEWILAPLREKVGWVPGHEREIEGRVWGGGVNVWATTQVLEDERCPLEEAEK